MQASNSLIGFFTDELILSDICAYLSIKDKLTLASTNKTIRSTMTELIKVFLKENGLPLIQGKSPLRLLRFYFDRCLRVIKLQEGTQFLLSTLQYPFKFQVITGFQTGNIYSACLNNKNRAYVFRTSALINGQDNKLNYQTINSVRSIHCKAQKLFYLKTDGSVCMCSTEKNSKEVIQQTSVLEWTIHIPIERMFVSYNYAIMFPQETSRVKIMKIVIDIDINEEYLTQQNEGQVLLVYSFLTKKCTLIRTPPVRMTGCAVGHNRAYFLTQEYQCYVLELDLILQGNSEVKLKEFQPFIGKNIVRIAAGHNFYLALERDMEKIEDWNVDRVVRWLRQIGFTPYIRIAQAQKLTGKKLINIDRKYMENILGITKTNMQQKFLMSIQEHIQMKKHDTDQLYGWGKNQFGQLGSSSANFIMNPQKIKMPNLKQTQHIDSIFCGWEQTFIRTQKGRIHTTVRKVEKKKERQYQPKMTKPVHKKSKEIQELQRVSDQEIEQSNTFQVPDSHNRGKYNKKRRKTEDKGKQRLKQQQRHKRFEEEEKWVESNMGKAFFVQGYKEFEFYIQCPFQHILESDKKAKLRTAKSVLDKILWGKKNKEDFKIGYIDKEMGVIEYSTSEIQNFEVKENRIKYFKQKGMVVWDRQSKIDNFD